LYFLLFQVYAKQISDKLYYFLYQLMMLTIFYTIGSSSFHHIEVRHFT